MTTNLLSERFKFSILRFAASDNLKPQFNINLIKALFLISEFL